MWSVLFEEMGCRNYDFIRLVLSLVLDIVASGETVLDHSVT